MILDDALDKMSFAELRIAFRTLRDEVADACDPKSDRFSPIAAEREEKRMVEYALEIADRFADAELPALAEV